VVIDDAKSYFARGKGRYDIIVSEPSNPWVSGVASLFTQEFYGRISGYLADGGVFCQWLHTYEMDAATLASIFEAVSRAFPDFVVYSTMDSDLVLIARKGGAAGTFDASALAYPALQPTLARLRLTEPDVVRRRRVADWSLLNAFFRSMGSPPNSDFYPTVEQWAPRARFTRERVHEFTDLQVAAIPFMEMLGASPAPASRRYDAALITQVEASTRLAWDLHDVLTGKIGVGVSGDLDTSYLAARFVRQWTTLCPAELAFEEALPSLVSVAEDVIPWLDRETAMRLWATIAASPCAKKLDAAQRRWIELFEASARRDAAGMARYGLQILESVRGKRNSTSEYAFFAAAHGVALQGDLPLALGLVEKSGDWVRIDGPHVTQLRFMAASIRASVPRSP
jgi:hypothetical protein